MKGGILSFILSPSRGKYLNQILIIFGCLILAKVIGVFAQARAALYLGPENYGLSGVFVSLLPFIILVTNLRMDIVLVRKFPELGSVESENALAGGVFLFRAGLFAMIFLIGCLALNENENLLLCWILATPLFLFSSLRPYWLLQARKRLHFHYLGMLGQTCITALIIFLFFKPNQALGSDLLVYGFGAIGAFVISCIGAGIIWPFSRLAISSIWKASQIALETRWVFIIGLFTIGYTSLEMPLIVCLRSSEEAAPYRTALMLSENFYTFLVIINSMLYPHFVDWVKGGFDNLFRMQGRILTVAILSLVPVLLILILAATWIYALLFQGVYDSGILPFKILVCAKIFLFLAGVYSWGLMAMGKDRTLFWVLGPLSLLSLVANIYLIPRFGIVSAASVSLVFSASYFVLIFGICYNLSTKNPR